MKLSLLGLCLLTACTIPAREVRWPTPDPMAVTYVVHLPVEVTPTDTVIIMARGIVSLAEQRSMMQGLFHDDIMNAALFAMDGSLVIGAPHWTGNWLDSVLVEFTVTDRLSGQKDTLNLKWNYNMEKQKWEQEGK